MDYISREKLRQAMYHEAFETDTELQKWESGCWIRYRLFTDVLDALPAEDVVTAFRCKSCEYYCDYGYCEFWNKEVKDYDFCSYGWQA